MLDILQKSVYVESGGRDKRGLWKVFTVSSGMNVFEPETTVNADGSADSGGQLLSNIQPDETAQPTGLREPGDVCGTELSMPSVGRTKNIRKYNLNHVQGLTHGLD